MPTVEEACAAITDALETRTHGVRSGTDRPGSAPLHFSVMGVDEPVARDLHNRFGELIEIRVAGHPYPFDPMLDVAPTPTRRPNAPDYGIDATTVLDPPFQQGIPSGSIVTGRVLIKNVSGAPIHWTLGSSVAEADLCDSSTAPDMSVVNVRNSHGRGVGGSIKLGANESCEVRFTGSTDSRDPRLGATLPPGEYQLVVALGVAGDRAGEGFEIICPPLPVQLTV